MKAVGIVGCGLMGGSLGRALRQRCPELRLVGVEIDDESRSAALGTFDSVTASPSDALRSCDVVVLAVPLTQIEKLLPLLVPKLHPNTVLTDVTGLKESVVNLVSRLAPGVSFIGSHPMVGGYRGGFQASRDDLFLGATVIVCPTHSTTSSTSTIVERLWRTAGAAVHRLSPKVHDRAVAVTSHLPYSVALLLLERGLEVEGTDVAAGPQWRDVTKRASFDPEVMATLSGSNPHLPNQLRALSETLASMAERLESDPRALYDCATTLLSKLGGPSKT